MHDSNYKSAVVSYLGVALCLLFFCACNKKSTASVPATTPSPTPIPYSTPKSPEALTALLEQRWTLERINRFATPGRRHWKGCQNLVAVPVCEKNGKGAVWEADLFRGSATGFDRIWWYATVCGDTPETYSVNAKRGNDYWLFEIGDLKVLETTQPEVEPSPNQCFEEGENLRHTK
jgi:hypothetical protein